MCATAIEMPRAFANRHADDALALLQKSRQLSDKSATKWHRETVQPKGVKYNSGISFAHAWYASLENNIWRFSQCLSSDISGSRYLWLC